MVKLAKTTKTVEVMRNARCAMEIDARMEGG